MLIEKNIIRLQTIIKFWPVAALVLVIYASVSLFILKDYLTGAVNLFNLLILIAAMPICIKRKKVLLASNMLAALGMTTIIPLLFTGGPANTGFWLSITYVIGVFLITTKRWAIFWLTLHLVVSSVIVALSIKGIVNIAYSIPELLNLFFIFVITFVFVFLFNKVLEYYLHLSEKRADELTRINKELTSTNKELEQFAYVASHDLQEPLRNITNYTGLLEKRAKENLNEESRHFLNVITKSANRMKILILELLNFSRVGRNRVIGKVDYEKIVSAVLSDLDSVIHESQAKITVESLPVIDGNETEIKQLFQNLLSNALKFKKKDVAPEIRIRCEDKDTEWEFSVNDNGIGIKEEYLTRVFGLFQRLHPESEYPGTGIGLSICKKIIELNNGKIWASSRPGAGSTFYFTIPKQ